MVHCSEAGTTFQQQQSSSNETHISFAAPAAITNTPGSDVIIRRGKLEEEEEAEKLKEIKLRKEKEKKAKAEISEKKKHDSSSLNDPAKDEVRKKKQKSNKKSKESSGKDGGKDAAVGVWKLRGEWERISTPRDPMTMLNHNRDRNPRECSSTSHGASGLIDIKKYNTTSPATPSETSTNIPSDVDKPQPMKFLIFGMPKSPFYHQRCIRKGFQVKNKPNSYQG